ncbi:hypothetical protein Lesp02_09890 [Lentzea sp. NBRC 105346]|uniref:ATP-binding protein n=1 Tax=Lentzea sp. NBRC 105346 TaxID=3032205 RepID=UPI0024A48CD5|nr:ATP-binding protein [Lentzea sp. NBRC 105346]GLZ28799.1 hypothetical protein Lesp02_09890 [Lentzea sp. NBRC 105346]
MIANLLSLDVSPFGRVTVVRPVGTLDLAGYPVLRDELLKLTTEEPAALVVRLDEEFFAPQQRMLAVFTTVWLKVSEWPGVPIVIVAETNRHRKALHASAVDRFVPVHATLSSAVASLARPSPHRVDRVRLPRSPAAPLYARTFVRDACKRWRVSLIADDVVVIASELVENAVQHAESEMVLRLELRPDGLSVAVRDEDPRPPTRLGLGHGTDLVARLSRTSGWSPAFDGGKVVWAVLAHP